MSTQHLEETTRQIRRHTIDLLKSVPASWLQWAPAGTSNHILWHAGHALWLQDELGLRPLTGESELPPGWAETFGPRCRPVAETELWPDRDSLVVLLEEQLARLLEVIRASDERLSATVPATDQGWDLTPGLIHGLHDEARHQGEMYLLIKLIKLAT